jgi:anti-sigma-K factor RskA
MISFGRQLSRQTVSESDSRAKSLRRGGGDGCTLTHLTLTFTGCWGVRFDWRYAGIHISCVALSAVVAACRYSVLRTAELKSLFHVVLLS